MRIVETDNYAGDYPNETFLNVPPMGREDAEAVAKAINNAVPQTHHRYWVVVDNDYKLVGGFEP